MIIWYCLSIQKKNGYVSASPNKTSFSTNQNIRCKKGNHSENKIVYVIF